jgi:hypothetical protein
VQSSRRVFDVAQSERDGDCVEARVRIRQLERVSGDKAHVGPALLADKQHAQGEIGRDDGCPAVHERLAGRARASCQIQDQLPGHRLHSLQDLPAPSPILAKRKHIIGQVVARGYPVEHRGDLAASLVEGGASRTSRFRLWHTHSLPWSTDIAGGQGRALATIAVHTII